SVVEVSRHSVLHPGDVSTLTVKIRNTGARTWTKGQLGQQVNLGVVGDDKFIGALGVGWPTPDRVAIQSEPTVIPGGLATFTFRVRGPSAPGVYPLRLRPVVDGVTWLEDDDVVSLITVAAPGAPTTPAPAAQPAGTTLTTINAAVPAVGGPSFQLEPTVDPASVVAGGTAKITARFATSNTSSGNVLGVLVHAPATDALAYQKWFHNEDFAAGDSRGYSVSWQVPVGSNTGTYTVELAVYSSGWKTLYASDASAASFGVSAPPPGPGATPTPAIQPPSPTPTPSASTTTTPPSATPGSSATASPTAVPATTPPATTPPATSSPSATPTSAPSFVLASSAAPASVAPGGNVTLTSTAKSATAVTAIIDVQI